MKKYLPFFFMLLFACRPGQQAETSGHDPALAGVQLLCSQQEELDGIPRSALYLLAGESKIKLADLTTCENIPAERFSDYQIPASATGAVISWWAGTGSHFYLLPTDNAVQVYRADIDEMQEDPVSYQLYGTYHLGKFQRRK